MYELVENKKAEYEILAKEVQIQFVYNLQYEQTITDTNNMAKQIRDLESELSMIRSKYEQLYKEAEDL